ncbi:META domain-containing protein [Gloeocapsopsis dulcis]|uniref:DUF306 domain-containing protein n=1 Tax=Gloeocapsopsis dulcis AAB1 = 1H9 TaxID=1433147 RepID=A0A6N8FXI0_9CHRO|nr:META domain-containing protein [Gloeocapsopsis dulcis]MUL37332.1 hypothetical protein [Gloeocapsopsis dulcis AAB1 = 1H9]WNN88958.1 META domain-containing protein [Gloeocapsopsis dulcis]
MQTRMVSQSHNSGAVSFILKITTVALLLSLPHTFSAHLPAMSSENFQSSVALNNSSWRLECWQHKGSAVVLVPQTEISLHFKGNQVNGFGGCNRFGGSFTGVGDQLSLGALDATQRGCNAAIDKQETQFFAVFQSVRRISSDASGRLVLFYVLDTNEGALYFAPMK